MVHAKSISLLSISVLLFISSQWSPAFFGQSPPDSGNAGQKAKTSSKKRVGKTIIWRDPGAVENLDFASGPGGRKSIPRPPFKFIEENLSGSNPKIEVEDAKGVKWSVKWGSEVNAEVFATRLAWATGYFVEPAYFLPSGKILGATGLTRAKKYVDEDGSFSDARFELKKEKGVKKIDGEMSWRWDQNPFVGTKEFNGLKIIMMLTSNFDNKDARDAKRGSNTAIFLHPVADAIEERYLVTDWGGSMGKWGGYLGREKWDCKGFAKQTSDFIKGVKKGFVVWGWSGQHTKDFTEGISVTDVVWLLQYIGRITDNQIRSGLQASGATQDEIDCFTTAIRDRINQMKGLQPDRRKD